MPVNMVASMMSVDYPTPGSSLTSCNGYKHAFLTLLAIGGRPIHRQVCWNTIGRPCPDNGERLRGP